MFFLKDEDYWLYLIGCIGVLSGALAFISPLLMFRVPGSIVLSLVGFVSFIKIRKDYSLNKAIFWSISLLIKAFILNVIFYKITN